MRHEAATSADASTTTDWEVAILGAGVGGMALATWLAKQGHRVVLVEKPAPSTFRGRESLDWEAPLFLKRLGFCPDPLVAEGKGTYTHGAIATSSAHPGVEAAFGFSPLFRVL